MKGCMGSESKKLYNQYFDKAVHSYQDLTKSRVILLWRESCKLQGLSKLTSSMTTHPEENRQHILIRMVCGERTMSWLIPSMSIQLTKIYSIATMVMRWLEIVKQNFKLGTNKWNHEYLTGTRDMAFVSRSSVLYITTFTRVIVMVTHQSVGNATWTYFEEFLEIGAAGG